VDNYAGYLDAWSNLKDIDKPTAFRLAAEIYSALVPHLNKDETDSPIIRDRRKRTFEKGKKAWISVATHLLFTGAKGYISEEEVLKIPVVRKHVKTEPYKHLWPLSNVLLSLYNLVEELHRRGIYDRDWYPNHNFPWLLAVGAMANQMLFQSAVLTGATSPHFPRQAESRTKKEIKKNTSDYFSQLMDGQLATRKAQNLFEIVAHFDKVLEYQANHLASQDEEFDREFWMPYAETRKKWSQQLQKPYFTILDAAKPGDRRGRKLGGKNKY
jgi:hypothetical protein